jgi:hypothetical protein
MQAARTRSHSTCVLRLHPRHRAPQSNAKPTHAPLLFDTRGRMSASDPACCASAQQGARLPEGHVRDRYQEERVVGLAEETNGPLRVWSGPCGRAWGIRTPDLCLERAASWAARRMPHTTSPIIVRRPLLVKSVVSRRYTTTLKCDRIRALWGGLPALGARPVLGQAWQ